MKVSITNESGNVFNFTDINCLKVENKSIEEIIHQARDDGFHIGVLAQTKEQMRTMAEFEKNVRNDEREKSVRNFVFRLCSEICFGYEMDVEITEIMNMFLEDQKNG